MKKTYQFLDIEINKPIYRKLSAVQYDNNSRYILVSVYSNFQPYDLTYATIKIYGIKKDKTVFFNNAKILDAPNGKFEIDLTEQCLACDGDVEIQILILGANQERLSSNSFILNVKKNIISPIKVTSQDEWGILTEGLASLAEYDIYKRNIETNSKLIKEIQSNHEGVVSLKSFYKDKANDYTLIFKEAINYCIAYNYCLFIPPGTYEVNQLKFDSISNLSIVGVPCKTIIKRKDNSKIENILQINDVSQNDFLFLFGLTFDGRSFIDENYGLVQGNSISLVVIDCCKFINTVNFNSISMSGNSHVIIRNCEFENVSSGPYLLCDYSLVENCSFNGSIKWGIQSTGTQHQVVTNCKFDGILGGVLCGNTSYESEIYDININNCIFNNIKSPGVNTGVITINKSRPIDNSRKSSNIKIHNNTFTDIEIPPLYVGGGSSEKFNFNCGGIAFNNNLVEINNSNYSCDPIFNIFNCNNVKVSNNSFYIFNSIDRDYKIIEIRGNNNKDIYFENNILNYEVQKSIKPVFVNLRGNASEKFKIKNLYISNFRCNNIEFSRLITFDVSTGATFDATSEIYFFNNKNDFYCNDDYSNDRLYNSVYYKYVMHQGRSNCKKDFSIGLTSYVEKTNKLVFWNGTNLVEIQTNIIE